MSGILDPTYDSYFRMELGRLMADLLDSLSEDED